MFDSLFTKVYTYFNPNWDFQVKNSLDAFRIYLNSPANPLIRMLASDTNGSGHQASTVGILRQLVNAVAMKGFAYQGNVEVYYGDDATLAKLYDLLPELNRQPVGTVVNATVSLIKSGDNPPVNEVNLGFTGGADDEHTPSGPKVPNFAKALNTRYFLRLQPYRWYLGDNQIQFNTDKKFITLTDEKILGYRSFAQRAYYLPVPIPAPNWGYYRGTPNETKAAIAQWITSQSAIDFIPVYGINNLSKSMFMPPREDRMFEVIAGMLASQKNNGYTAPGAKPIIVLSLGNFKDDANKVRNLVNGDKSDMESFSENEKVTYQNRKKYLIDVNAAKRVRFVWVATMANINAQLNWLKGANDRVLLVQLGGVPKPIFNYLLQTTTLPFIFEGQGTANDALNIGKYYFQAALDTNGVQYPTTVLGLSEYIKAEVGPVSVYYPSLPLNIQTIANEINAPIYQWPSLAIDSPAEALGNFIKVYREESPDEKLHKYFKLIADFYQNSDNDKFAYAVSFLNYIVSKAQASSLMLRSGGMLEEDTEALLEPVLEDLEEYTNEEHPFHLTHGGGNDGITSEDAETVLEQLLSDLEANTNAGKVLNLIPGVFNSGAICDFYTGLLGAAFSITKSTTTPVYDDSNILISILVTGNNSALGNAQMQIAFTAPQDVIVSNTRFLYDESWAPSQLPWFRFSKPFFEFDIIDADTINAGAVGGTIDSADITLSIQLPMKDGKWQLTGEFDSPYPSISKFYQLAGGVNLTQTLPAPFNALSEFGLKNTQLVYDSVNTLIEYTGFTFATDQPYKLLNNLFLEEITALVNVQNPGSVQDRFTTWSVNGTFKIGEGEDAGIVALGVVGPELVFTGALQSGVIKPTDLFSIFLPGVVFNPPSQPVVTDFNFTYAIQKINYTVMCRLNIDWPITMLGVNVFTIMDVGVSVSGQGSALIGGIDGSILLLPDDPNVNLTLHLLASYSSVGNTWLFEGEQTDGVLSISGLLKEYLGWDTGMTMDINGLKVSVSTGTNYWNFAGKTAQPWVIDFLDLEISGNALIGYGKRNDTSAVGKYGSLLANVNWLGIELTVFYDFDPGYASYGIRWELLQGKVVEDKKTGHTIATLSFTESASIGSMVETFVSWATGTKFGLASPWNLLNSVPLNNLSLVYDFTDKKVSFNIGIGPIDLGFVTIKGISVSYNTADPDPDKNGVIVTLDVTSAWGDVPPWNAAKPETTPAPPGQGNKYLDLRLLAMGQHVTLDCFKTADNVQAAIACMSMLPDPKPGEIPPVRFDANSNWLTGMDFGILKLGGDDKKTTTLAATADAAQYFLTLQIIFNDPYLYALRVALEGEPAKIFKGLDFQIMYKKISENIGLYQAEIVLPDVMRKINMGQFNITLPVFGIAIFTNGNFQVDIGFPWKEDFSRSFTFQTLIWTPIGIPIPVMGSAGVYFGHLSSATTNRVPAATNGTFNPVLVFGFGIQFGFGYSFDAGILKAGFSLTAVAILEGILAKWNPYQITDGSNNNTQLDTSYYFWFRGTVGIIGKLYGTVDFAIVKAELNIDIRLLVQITFASYEPIELSLTASVSVSLRVTINLGLFKIRISFSFSARIQESITINAIGGTPPWQTAAQVQLLTGGIPILKRRSRKLYYNQKELMAVRTLTNPIWSNLIKATTPAPLTAYAGLGLTMAGDNAQQLSQQQACYIAMLFIASVPPPQDDRVNGKLKAYSTGADTSFELLSKQVFRWAIASIQSGPVTSEQVDAMIITDLQIAALLDYLSDTANPTPIPAADVTTFLTNQFLLTVNAPTSGEADATYFPVPPEMVLTLPDYGTDYKGISYNFADYNSTSAAYTEYLRTYFNELAVQVAQEQSGNLKAFQLDDSDGQSMASFIFSDYFLLVCKQMLQSARESLKDFKYYLQDGQQVNDIINWVNQKAGTDVYSIEALFTDNVSAGLSTDKKLRITGSSYIVQASDTFDSIAAQAIFFKNFTGKELATANQDTASTLATGITISYPGKDPYKTLTGQSLSQVATAIGVPVADLISNGNITGLAGLLLPVATLAIPSFDSTTATGDTLNKLASKYNITQQQLAAPAENGMVTDLFDKLIGDYINIANLQQFQVGELLKEIQATNGLQHLSGMTSRYYMAGLRLPTSGITPAYKGMWVTDNSGTLSLPAYAGLYALTGQQFPIPALTAEDNFDIAFSKPSGISWLSFSGSDPSKLTLPLVPGSHDAQQISAVTTFAINNSLDIPLSTLGAQDAFLTKAATYPFTSEIIWNSASAFAMPYGGNAGGVPALSLWQLPDTLLQLPDLQTRQVNPRMKMQIGRYDESSRSMINTPVTYYGYGSLVSFTIKKVPVVTESPATLTTYEIMGADGSNVAILEKMVSGIGNDKSLIATLTVAYEVDTNSTTTAGIQTDALNSLTMGIAQVNLSTETRPDTFAASLFKTDVAQEEMVLLNETTDFIRLLWQASITRGGGYYLYYFNSGNNSGLPDRIFNDNNEATLSLLVLYTAPQDDAMRDNVTAYMNALAIGEAIDTTHSVLFAEANPFRHVTPSDNTQTLGGLAYGYYGNIADVAADNGKNILRTGISLLVNEGVYEVRPEDRAPGGKIAAIATYFGTTIDEIKAANPLQTSWPDPLPLYTALHLPKITITIGNSKGGSTLEDLAAYYGEDITALASKNQEVAGIFADNEQIIVKGGPDIRTSNVSAGVAGIAAERAVPLEIPDDPSATDYGMLFLLNTYNMLSYQVAENNYFAASNLGLPATPSGETDNQDSNDKVSFPKTLAAGDNWQYAQSIPYSRFAKNATLKKGIMPDQANSPYRGLGGLLQIDFAWQDLYGNRLITTLSNPSGNSQLNMPPVLTGYTDPIIGLNQWPSVAPSWEVNTDDSNTPQLQLNLSFGDSYYQGLLWAKAAGTNSITAWFTEPLEEISATDPVNYSIDHGISINSITLGTDKQTITLQVDNLPQNLLVTLSINNISNAGKTETYTGIAQFSSPDVPEEATSTIIEQAKKDLQVYQQLWYQLTDPNGIAYTVNTTLLKNSYTLSDAQASDLVNDWIASIFLFLENRAQGFTDVASPTPEYLLTFTIDPAQLNEAQIFRLDLSFTIKRTRNAAAGDFETTGGILQAVTEVAPLSGTEGGDTHSLNTFAARFEAALLQTGEYALRIATGTDREAASNSKETWAVRLGLNKNTPAPISYAVTDVANPNMFAPRPISNKLETRPQVPLYYYSEKNGIDFNTPSAFVDFTSIDMDQWGQQFFNSIDNVLSPEFTAAIQLVDNKKNTSYLEQLLAGKKSLADIIKEWMIPVFSGETADATAVQEAFKQLLLEKLTNAYTTQAAVQFHATVSADAATGIAPRLYGSISRNFKFTDAMVDAADNTLVYLFFTNPPDTAAAISSNFIVSDGLIITSAGIDPNDTRRVILKLNGQAIANSTQVTVSKGFTDMTGNVIIPPLIRTTLAEVNEGNNSDSITFTSPKLTLQKDEVTVLPFLITSPQIVRGSSDELLPYVDLNLSYAGSAIEHQISTLPNIEDYEASTWLSFVTPLDNTSPLTEDLGKIQVPIVLRAFPTAPSMVNQSGESTVPPNASNIAQLLNWNYNIVYSLQIHYPQDELDFTINFNVMDNSNAMLMKGIEDAFPQLAEFITVAPSVYQVLETQLTKVTATTADSDPLLDTVSTALISYTALMSNVVNAAQGNAMVMSHHNNRLFSTQVLPYVFYIQEGSATVGEVQALIISIHGLPPEGVGQPLVNIEGYERHNYDQGCTGDFCYYYTQNGVVLPAAQGQTIPERTVVIPAMNILARQDAATTTLIRRNAELVPGKPCSEPFIYTTGTVEFSNPYHPTTDCVTPVDISLINAPSGQHNFASLTTQLTNLFNALLMENSQDTLSFLMSSQYSYQLNTGLGEVTLPVVMQPIQSIQVKPDASTGNKQLADMINDWANSIELWYNTVNPDTTNAAFWFDLTIFSSLTQQPLPLVRLRALNLGIQYITGL